MSDYSDIVKQGYLRTKSQKLGNWQKRWVVLRRASSRGPNRLERFENEKNAMLCNEPKVVNLMGVEKVERTHAETRLYVLTLCFAKGPNKKFAADSDMDASDWFEVLNQHIGENIPIMPPTAGFDGSQPDPRDMFHVYLLPNTNTEFCGEYLLRVNASSIILHEPFDLMKPLVTWKLNTLRSYGRDESKFTFEAGRLAETGEGLFIFTTVEAEQVYQKVNSATQAFATVQNMNRRQQAGLLSDRSVQSEPRSPVSRHNSDTATSAKNYTKNQPIAPSKSLPMSQNREITPLPRSFSSAGQTDNNANTDMMFGQTQTQCDSLSKYNRRPLPPAPREDHSFDNKNYNFDDLGLSAKLTNFLKETKQDN